MFVTLLLMDVNEAKTVRDALTDYIAAHEGDSSTEICWTLSAQITNDINRWSGNESKE